MQAMDTAQLIALAGALGWASGVRLYLVVLLTGLAGFMGWVTLPPGLHLLAHPVVLGASGFMVFVEFFADKIPGLDSLWDVVHTLIRIPAGAALAAGVFGADSGLMALLAALAGGTLAATSHAAKATARAAINTSPNPSATWVLLWWRTAWCRWACGWRLRTRWCLWPCCSSCWWPACG